MDRQRDSRRRNGRPKGWTLDGLKDGSTDGWIDEKTDRQTGKRMTLPIQCASNRIMLITKTFNASFIFTLLKYRTITIINILAARTKLTG